MFKKPNGMAKNGEFEIHSINLIAYLRTKGIEPIRKESVGGQVSYIFVDDERLNIYVKEYKSDQNLQKFITKLSETRREIKGIK